MTEEIGEEPLLPSKSQKKREAQALQDLGEQLTSLSAAKLHSLPLSDAVLEAIEAYNRLPNSHGARKRQLQYIGKVMRDCDYDELLKAYEKLQKPQTVAKTISKTDQWLERIVSEGDPAINALVASQPAADRQKLRQLQRNIRKLSPEKKTLQQEKLKTYLSSFNLEDS